MRPVGRVELPELHKNCTAQLRAGRMSRLWRVADIAPRRKISMLILEHALKHKKLLTAIMHMWRELALGCIAHYARGAGDLLTDPVEHASFHTGHGRSLPIEFGGVHYGAFSEICV